MLAGYAPVPATGWGIVAQRPTEATLQPLSRLMTAVIWNAIPLGLLSLLVTWWFARRISLPLWQLARNVQGGEDTGMRSATSAASARGTEVAQLKQAVLHSFNALQDRIGTLNRASRTDPLTGLLNRRGLQQALDALQVQGIPFAILALDIDRFKSINDSHGHDVGDAAIVHIADQMRRYSRDSDILCRAGGEEFLLLLPGISTDSARQAGERLRQHIADHPFEPVGTITVSLGVAHFPASMSTPSRHCGWPTRRCTWPRNRAATGWWSTRTPTDAEPAARLRSGSQLCCSGSAGAGRAWRRPPCRRRLPAADRCRPARPGQPRATARSAAGMKARQRP